MTKRESFEEPSKLGVKVRFPALIAARIHVFEGVQLFDVFPLPKPTSDYSEFPEIWAGGGAPEFLTKDPNGPF